MVFNFDANDFCSFCPAPVKNLVLKVFSKLWALGSIFIGLPGLQFLRRTFH